MEPSDKLKCKLLTDPETCGSVLLVIALHKYKEQVFAVDPMTLIMDLEDDFQVALPKAAENKLKAILLATATQVFQQDPEAFQGICTTLWYGDPQLDYHDKLTLTEAIWGMFEVKACHGEIELNPGVQATIACASENEVGDSEVQETAYAHVREAMEERYRAWQDQMISLGVEAKDLPPLEG